MNDIVQLLSNRDSDRLRRYIENLDFYNGKQYVGTQRYGERRLTFNYAKVFIDKLTSYLMSGVTYAVEPLDDTPELQAKAQKAERTIVQVAAESNLDLLDFDTEIDCAVLGDACYKVLWDSKQKRVRITSPDVQGIYAWWLGDDVSRIYRVASKYQLAAEECELLYPSVKGLLQGKNATVIEDWTDQNFSLYVDGKQVSELVNPYGFIPFIIYPNLREPKQFWGVSDIPPIMEPQRELNRAVSQLSRILELSGNPIAVLENVETSEDIAVKPGAVWNIPEDAKAYLLDLLQGGGIRLHIDYISQVYRALHDVSESPKAAFGNIERDLSGVALEIELQPLLQKVNRKRLIRSAVYRRRNEMILTLLGKYSGQDFSGLRHRIVWAPVLPQDLTRKVQAEQLLVQTGIHSIKRAMDDMGVIDPEAEFNSWLGERKQIRKLDVEISQMLNTGEYPVQKEVISAKKHDVGAQHDVPAIHQKGSRTSPYTVKNTE